MRCKNCGWPNKPNETTCVKCHSPLTPDDEHNAFDDNVSNVTGSNSGVNLKQTVREDDVFGYQNVQKNQQQVNAIDSETEGRSESCPKCGYPVRPGADKCPNCKFQLSGVPQSQYQPHEPERRSNPARRPTRMDNGSGSGNFRGTINPYMMNMEMEPSFVLKPIKRENERHDLEEMEYEGKSVSLNRSNTEENNSSITSREQAVITNIDGHWYIEDKSEQKTTFVQAAKQIELHDGDLILLGNRLFEFCK